MLDAMKVSAEVIGWLVIGGTIAACVLVVSRLIVIGMLDARQPVPVPAEAQSERVLPARAK